MTRNTKKMGRLAAAASFLVWGALTSSAQAQTSFIWDAVPEVGLIAESISNPRLRPPGQPEAARDSNRAIIDAQVRLDGIGQRGNVRLEPRVLSDRYNAARDDELQSDDLFLRAEGEYNWQRVIAGLQVRLAEEGIRNSEISNAIPDDPDIIDPDNAESGDLLFFDGTRERTILRPNLVINLSERTGLVFEGQYQNVDYVGTVTGNRSDFQEKTFATGLVRRAGELNEVSARFLVSDYFADLTQNQTNSVGVVGGFTRPLSETWTISLTAGVYRHDFVFTENGETIDNADSTPILSLNFLQRGLRNTLNLALDQRVAPSSSGVLAERTEARFFAERTLTQRLTGVAGIRLIETRSVGNLSEFNDRRDVRVEFQLGWAITQRFFLDARYAYTSRDFLNSGTKGDSNALAVGIRYQGLSRFTP